MCALHIFIVVGFYYYPLIITVELENSQVMLKGCGASGYVIVCASSAKVMQCSHLPVWREGHLTNKTSWVGKLDGLQVREAHLFPVGSPVSSPVGSPVISPCLLSVPMSGPLSSVPLSVPLSGPLSSVPLSVPLSGPLLGPCQFPCRVPLSDPLSDPLYAGLSWPSS